MIRSLVCTIYSIFIHFSRSTNQIFKYKRNINANDVVPNHPLFHSTHKIEKTQRWHTHFNAYNIVQHTCTYWINYLLDTCAPYYAWIQWLLMLFVASNSSHLTSISIWNNKKKKNQKYFVYFIEFLILIATLRPE